MVKTTKKINLAQLDKELGAGGLNMESKDGEHIISAVDEKITDAQLEIAIKAHNAKEETNDLLVQKLASVGLNVDDLKAALGL